ncbi:O-antigen ligase family protein [Acaryochloris thomasi]|nr:O-antigen ligase family protein [Acaryochloris thomasi]
MGIVMLWTAFTGLSEQGWDISKAIATVVTFLKGYFLIFACFLLPMWNRVRVAVITRAVVWMTSGYLISLTVQITLLFLGLSRAFSPPWARFMPGNPLSFRVNAATFQPFFGIPLPRTPLYMPDPPILGICGLLCFLICLGEPNHRLRQLGMAGSLSALIISQSRLGWICLPIALLIIALFRSPIARQGAIWVSALISLLCTLLGGLTLSELLNKPLTVFTNARPASSTDREFVVRKTLEAWQESPWLGWGVAHDSAKWHTFEITLGSFSSYAGVLYLHGILGFVCLITAIGSTLWHFLLPALRGNLLCKKAFASVVALSLFMEGIPLSWMAVYFWYFLIWLGAIISQQKQEKNSMKKLENFSPI